MLRSAITVLRRQWRFVQGDAQCTAAYSGGSPPLDDIAMVVSWRRTYWRRRQQGSGGGRGGDSRCSCAIRHCCCRRTDAYCGGNGGRRRCCSAAMARRFANLSADLSRTQVVPPKQIAQRRFDRGTARLRWQEPRGLIFLYHRIASTPTDPWSLNVTPDHFAEHLQVLESYGDPVSLPQLLERFQDRDTSDRMIAVTFDDGYPDNLHTAKPLLERFAVPATVFVTVGALGDQLNFGGTSWMGSCCSQVRSLTHCSFKSTGVALRGRSATRPTTRKMSLHASVPGAPGKFLPALVRRSIARSGSCCVDCRLANVSRCWMSSGRGLARPDPPTDPPLPLICGGAGLEGRALVDSRRPHAEPSVACHAHSRCPTERDRAKPVSIDGSPRASSERPLPIPLANDRITPRKRSRLFAKRGSRVACTSIAGLVKSSTDRLHLPRLRSMIGTGTSSVGSFPLGSMLTSRPPSVVSINAGRATAAREVRRSAQWDLESEGSPQRRPAQLGRPTRQVAHGKLPAGR